MVFLVLHAYVWPYPHPGANILKLVTEAQVVLVMGTVLVFRFPKQQLENETIQLLDVTANLQFYQTALEIMLVATLVPIVAVLAFPSDAERAQSKLVHLASRSAESLEATATTEQARDRIRAVVSKVMVRASVSHVLATLGAQAGVEAPTVAVIFRQIDGRGGELTGTIKPGELTAWWGAAEPPVSRTAEGQPVVTYSRLSVLRAALAEMELQPGEELDCDDVHALLECLLEAEHESITDASIGREYLLYVFHTTTQCCQRGGIF